MCGWIHGYCPWPIEGHCLRSSGPVNSRSLTTGTVLWPKNRCHGFEPGNLVLVKADAFQGKRKLKDRWEDKPHEVVCQIMTDVPSHKVTDQHGQSHVLHYNWLLLIASETGVPLCGCLPSMQQMYQPQPSQANSQGSDSETMPQEDSGLAINQHQARKTSLGWINRKPWLLPWASAGASTEDGWRLLVMCSGSGCLQDHMCLAGG